jgi:membrane protease YdiL (CAAX protease family)
MAFEPDTESPARGRSMLAPPGGSNDGLKSIFWNECELRAGWRLLGYVVLSITFAGVGKRVAVFLNLPQITHSSFNAPGMLVQELVLMIAALAAAAIFSVLEKRPFPVYGLPVASGFRARFWQGIVWGLVVVTGVILLIWLPGGYSFGSLALRGRELWSYAALWALVFLCVGVFEEFLFRGYTQFTLTTGIGFWPAATMVSGAFAAVHLGNTGESAMGALGVFAIAMFFCLTLRRTGNLWFAVGMHASFDWGQTFLFSVPDSGLVAPGHLLNSSIRGPVWLTGGTVGPEASIMAFIVLALAAVIFDRLYRPREEDSSTDL